MQRSPRLREVARVRVPVAAGLEEIDPRRLAPVRVLL
jgi:hypothetical protein